MCTKANLRLLFFFPLFYESLGWCVVGRWNNSVDNIFLSAGFDPTGVRSWLDAPPLSPYLRLRGPTQDRWPIFFFFFCFFLHHHGSRFQVGFLFPVQAECRLWAKEQYCVHRAGKKLHVASHDIMQENYVCFQPRVDVYLCIHVVREKQPFRVCVPLPNQMNDIIYVMN